MNPPNMHYLDSSSNTSSCNSSTPSSPAVLVTSHPTPPHSASVYPNNTKTRFTFDPPGTSYNPPRPPQPSLEANKPSSPTTIMDSFKSTDSDKTLSGSSGSAGTAIRLDSQDSTASVDDSGSTWASRQTSISMREWDIPYEEVSIGDKIGSGRFSTGTTDTYLSKVITDQNAILETQLKDLKNQIKRQQNQIQDQEIKIQELKEVQTCKICMDDGVAYVFIPCGHAICCGKCIANISRCPTCRAKIQKSQKIFFS